MSITEGQTVTVKCLDNGATTDAMVVTRSSGQVRVNMSGLAMNFRPDAKGRFAAQRSGLSFVIETQD